MKKNFDFVNVTPSDTSNPEYKRQVHVQAMRSFRRQQRLQNVEAYERETRQAADREEKSDEEPAQNVVLDQSAYFSTGTIDPFLALPSGFDEHQDLLLYFQHRIGPMLVPDDIRQPETSWSTQWLHKAVASPMMLTATCSHAAVFIDDVQGNELSARALHFQSQTIRLLNESLETGVCDDAIATVLMLVGNTIVTGSASEMHTHMLALDRMVSIRGGRENIGEGSPIQIGTLWQIGAYHALQKPDHWSAILDVPRVPAVDTAHEVSTLLAKCRDLTRLRLELDSPRGVERSKLRQFSDQRSVLECQLGRLRYQLQDETPHDNDRTLLLNRVMCLAALFYVFFYLRRFMMGGLFTDNMIYELVDVLVHLDESFVKTHTEATVEEREAALWASLIGSRFAQASEQLDLTRALTLRLAGSLHCVSIEQWTDILGRFVWPKDAWNSTIFDLTERSSS